MFTLALKGDPSQLAGEDSFHRMAEIELGMAANMAAVSKREFVDVDLMVLCFRCIEMLALLDAVVWCRAVPCRDGALYSFSSR